MMMLHSGATSPHHEPMVMGSPPSPSGPGGYLPGFLMGGDASFHAASPGLLRASGSPLPQRQTAAAGATSVVPAIAPQRLLNASGFASPASAPRKRTPMGLDARGRQAPPTNSLWGTPGHAQRLTEASPHVHSTPGRDPGVESPANRSLFKDLSFGPPKPTPAPLEAFYKQGDSLRHDEGLDERWVTIFGYPQKAANFVVEQFSHCGTIVKYKIENEGNWVHVKFQTKLQACKALSKNGKLLTEKVMIGVQPCADKRVMAEDDGAVPLEASVDASGIAPGLMRSQAPGHPGTPGPCPSSALAEQSFNTSMRSLTARAGVGGVESARHREIEEDSTGKDRDGWMNKAFGYVFGWS